MATGLILALMVSRAASAQLPAPEVVASNLIVPWALAFAADGRLFFTERAGRVRVIDGAGVLQVAPVIDLTNVVAPPIQGAEHGLMGIVADPNFLANGYLYVYYTYKVGAAYRNRVVRLLENGTGSAVEDSVLLANIPGNTIHDGGRIKIGPDGKLYIATGTTRCALGAQDVNQLDGKILRMNLDGTPPNDNPFPGPAPKGLVYAYGNRNPQGLAWDANGQLYETEHGPTGDCGWPSASYDEVNIIYPGANYGWPLCRGICGDPAYVDPIRLFFPETVPPAGAAFYGNSFYFGTLGFPGNTAARHIHMLTFDPVDPAAIIDDQVQFDQFGRIRDVVAGPDGYLYFCTSNRDGRGADVQQPGDDKIYRVLF
jgi:glucose/arabinose dehydrogenase